MDVLEQAGEAVRKWDTQRPEQIVPAGLHVLTGSALGVALTAHVLMVRSHDVGDEVVVTTGGLEEGNHIMQNTRMLNRQTNTRERSKNCKEKKNQTGRKI